MKRHPQLGRCLLCVLASLWLLRADLVVCQEPAAEQEADVAAAEEPKPKEKLGLGAALGALVRDAFQGVGRQDINANAQNEAAVKQFEQQYQRQIDQIYRTELHFIRLVCQPSRQDFQKLSDDAKVAKQKAIRKLALSQQRGGIVGQPPQARDPRHLIATQLAKVVRAHLSTEQAARYEAELQRREEALRQVAVLNIVAKLDKRLRLTADQRTDLQQVLADNWHDSWGQTQLMMYENGYFPHLPVNKILPVLNETQQKAWHGVYKAGNVFFGVNFGMVQGIEIEEEQWGPG